MIVVAARNEADRIGDTLAALARGFPDAVVWVADDGSSDATARLARSIGAQVVSSGRRLGKGAAVTLAARHALGHRPAAEAGAGSPVFVFCDGDLGDSAARLGPLRDCVANHHADVAVAVFASSVGGGLGVARGFARWAIERRCATRTRAPISGQRALSLEALHAVLPLADGYGMEIGITIDARRAGHTLQEIELELAHRATGRSPGGFAHRARQLIDFVAVYHARR